MPSSNSSFFFEGWADTGSLFQDCLLSLHQLLGAALRGLDSSGFGLGRGSFKLSGASRLLFLGRSFFAGLVPGQH